MAEMAEFNEKAAIWAQYDQSASLKEKGAGVMARLGINRKLLQV